LDAGGGQNVGWIEQGDWMDFAINPSVSGIYSLKLRIATPNTGGQLQVRKADGTVLATVNLPNTGWWQTWQTATTNINLTAGAQTIRVISTATAGWNINWLEFSQGGGATITARRDVAPVLTETSTFAVYPNPVRESFTLSLNSGYSGAVKVQVINMTGAVQKQFVFNKANGTSQRSFSIGDLPKGQYILLLETKESKQIQKLIKL